MGVVIRSVSLARLTATSGRRVVAVVNINTDPGTAPAVAAELGKTLPAALAAMNLGASAPEASAGLTEPDVVREARAALAGAAAHTALEATLARAVVAYYGAAVGIGEDADRISSILGSLVKAVREGRMADASAIARDLDDPQGAATRDIRMRMGGKWTANGWAVQWLGEALLSYLDELGAVNMCEWKMVVPAEDGGGDRLLVLTAQWADGKTPMDLRGEERARADAAEAELARWRAAGPTANTSCPTAEEVEAHAKAHRLPPSQHDPDCAEGPRGGAWLVCATDEDGAPCAETLEVYAARGEVRYDSLAMGGGHKSGRLDHYEEAHGWLRDVRWYPLDVQGNRVPRGEARDG